MQRYFIFFGGLRPIYLTNDTNGANRHVLAQYGSNAEDSSDNGVGDNGGCGMPAQTNFRLCLSGRL